MPQLVDHRRAPRTRAVGRALAAACLLMLPACEFGRAFGGGDLVVRSTEYFFPPEKTYYPFDMPFPLAGRDPIASAGEGRINFLGSRYQHRATRNGIVIRDGQYSQPLPVHIYQRAGTGNERPSWLLLFEADVIADGEYSGVSPRRVPIDYEDRQCLIYRLVSGLEAQAIAEAVAKASDPFGTVMDCAKERKTGVYDPKTNRFTVAPG